MSSPMMATTTRIVARSAAKTMVNDSMAFYPSKTSATNAMKGGDSFAYYASTTGAIRIPKTSTNFNMAFIRNQNQEPAAQAVSKYSRAELESMFAKSRVAQQQPATRSQNLAASTTGDSFAFYPAGRNTAVNNKTTSAKDPSFAFYPSQGVTRDQEQLVLAASKKSKKQPSTSSNAQAAAEEASDNNMSLFAAGSFAMGLMVQAGRTLARP
mmetsp:Transcript_96533/g.270194  ORF Transcript_96533/g.270194 Transcript_96533/m.270194 type:complete len:211 (-) Transcript_96533:50-682(-)